MVHPADEPGAAVDEVRGVVTADAAAAALDVDEVTPHVRIEDLGRNRADCRRGGGG